jgi:hypothetical protein
MEIKLSIIGLLFVLGACADADANVNAKEDEFDTESQDPEFIGAAEDLLNETSDARQGWERGVVISEDDDNYDWQGVVLTKSGAVTILDTAINCDDDNDDILESSIYLMVDTGDLIEWSTAGGDAAICSAELNILSKAAVSNKGP